jgi:hypothetical protein
VPLQFEPVKPLCQVVPLIQIVVAK